MKRVTLIVLALAACSSKHKDGAATPPPADAAVAAIDAAAAAPPIDAAAVDAVIDAGPVTLDTVGPITIEKLQAMAKDPKAFSGFVDDATGFFDIHQIEQPNDGPSADWVKHLCGKPAAALVNETRGVIVERIGDEDHESTCTAIEAPGEGEDLGDDPDLVLETLWPGGERCLIRGAMEYDISYELYFRPDGANRKLAFIDVIDVGSMITSDQIKKLKTLMRKPNCK